MKRGRKRLHGQQPGNFFGLVDEMKLQKWTILALFTLLLAAPVLGKSKGTKKAPAAPTVPAGPKAQTEQKPAPEQKPTMSAQPFVEGLYARLGALSKAAPTLDVLHQKIGAELDGVVDYPEMARLALGAKWTEIDAAQKQEFLKYLAGMVQKTYVKRFKPGQDIQIRYAPAPKSLGEDRVQVASTMTVGKTSAEVAYALHPVNGQWRVYDIVVDEASQVQTYRQSFKKILDKEGWPGLMTRMKKAAAP